MPERRVKLPTIVGFVFDDENEAKIHEHGLTVEQVDQILDNPHLVVPNRRNRRSPVLVLGTDDGGRCIAAPAEPTYDVGYWRPITAWPCKATERQLITRRRQRGG